MSLTETKIKKLTKPGRYFDERGLHLVVRKKAKSKSAQHKAPNDLVNRTWILRFERNAEERWMGLGPHPDVSLDMAREEARKARLLLRDGIDPIEERKQRKQALLAGQAAEKAKSVTFEQAALQYYEFHQVKWDNPKHKQQFTNTLAQYARPISRLTVAAVDKAQVLKVLEQTIMEDGKPVGRFWDVRSETANRVRQRIEAVLNYAQVRGYREGLNPARWKGHLDQVLLSRADRKEKVESHRMLPYAEVPEFMRLLRERESVAARALEFTILTAARTSETTGAVWDEFDLDAGIWTVPAERMKAGREHRVPLTQAVVDLLKGLRSEKGNPYVFLGPRKAGLSNMSLAMLLRRMGYADKATTHGFRSAFSTWRQEKTNFSPEVAEAALAHSSGDAVERAYKRGDVLEKRRLLMQAWANYCAKPLQTGNVEPFRRAG